MADLIDRQVVLNALIKDERYNEDIPNRSDGVRDAIITVLCIPAVDAVPVVRCKDCKYSEQDDYGWICTNIDGGIMGDENGNGFCCEGERRKE